MDRRREQSRRRLLDAGRIVIGERGVAGLTVGEVTETADLGRGSFYNHFADKADLVAEVAREIIVEVAEQALDLPPAEADPAVQTSLADQRFVSLADTSPSMARLIVNLARESPVFFDTTRPYARRLLEAGAETGRFRFTDVEMTLLILQSSALEVMRTILEGTAVPDAPVLHAESMLVLFGVPPAEATRVARIVGGSSS